MAVSKQARHEVMPTHQILVANEEVGWWGWTEDPAPPSPVRMYLRRFTGERAVVELEDEGGRRALLPTPGLSKPVEMSLAVEVLSMRAELEARWLDLIRGWGWVTYEWNRVIIYGGSDLAFTRVLPVVGVDVETMDSSNLAPLIWRP